MPLDKKESTIRAVNLTIREFADDPHVSADAVWEFFCECGCFTLVPLSIADFDGAEHVWAEGHEGRLLST